MKRTGYLGVSLFLISALAVSALPAFGQQPKTKPEYDAYMLFFNEKDPAKRAANGEKFIADFKESEMVPGTYTGIISAYLGAKNWPKVIEIVEKVVAMPGTTNQVKAFAYANAMLASQNANDVDKVISYGEKTLAIQPDDIRALIAVSGAIPLKLPADAAGKTAALDKADSLATKGLAGIQGMLAKASAADKAELQAIEGSLYATRGLVAYTKMELSLHDAVQRDPVAVGHVHFGMLLACSCAGGW